jgi:Tol biopolymer transport system component
MSLGPGTRLGPYEIIAPLGAGGMGEVYRARDPRLGREVAVKVLPSAMAGDAERQVRFEAEARAAGALNHPNIVTLHDVGIAGGMPYLVTEVLEGESLRDVARQGAVPVPRAVEIVTQVAAGLEAAHSKGIVHRDLKPENLFVLPDGRVKILDFGIAKLMRADSTPSAEAETTPVFASLTATGTIMGTVSYMAPEQLRDRPVDQRADLFALGAILHELLTGRQPFAGETAADRVSAILMADPPALPEAAEAELPGLGDVVGRLLAKHPERRFQSAADFAFALRLLQAHGGASRAGSGADPASRSPGTSHEVTFRQLTFRDGDIEAARFSPDGQTVTYRAAWGGAPSDIYITRIESPEASPLGLIDTGLESVSATAELAIILRAKNIGGFVSVGTLARIPMVGGRPREVAESVFMADWSPDGKSLAAIRMVDGRLQLEAPLGKVLHVASGWISYPRWSPDGAQIAFGEHPAPGNNAGYVSIIRPGEPARRLTPLFEMISRTAWRPDSREVWFGGQMQEMASAGIYGVSLDGAVRRVYSAPGWPVVSDVARNGDALIVMVRPRMRLEAGTRRGGPESVQDLSWLDWSLLRDLSPDGSLALFDETGLGTGGVHGVYLRSTDGAPAIRLADGICSYLSPDGRWALAGDHRRPGILRMVPTGAGATRTIDFGDFAIGFADWVPNREQLVLTGAEPGDSRRLWLYDLETGTRRRIGDDAVGGVMAKTSPDGRLVVFRNGAGSIQVVEIETGRAHDIGVSDPSMRPAGWTADSKSVFVFHGGAIPARVLRVDVVTADAEPWMEIRPSQRSGVDNINSVRLSEDGERYACSYPMIDSTLYLARGLV